METGPAPRPVGETAEALGREAAPSMGKHSLPDRGPFWRSLVFFVLKWALLLALPVLAGWGLLRFARNPTEAPPGAVIVPSGGFPSPAPSPTPSPTTSPTPVSPPSPTPPPAERPGGGRLQVLNGTGAGGVAQRAADLLTAAGYRVVAVQGASRRYPETTVFFQPGFEQMANEVVAVLGAGVARPALPNLDRSIPVAVVVGDDFPG